MASTAIPCSPAFPVPFRILSSHNARPASPPRSFPVDFRFRASICSSMRVREHLLPSSGSPLALARARAGGSHGFVNLHDHSLRTLNLPAPLGPVADACEPPPAFAVYRPNLACAGLPRTHSMCFSPLAQLPATPAPRAPSPVFPSPARQEWHLRPARRIQDPLPQASQVPSASHPCSAASDKPQARRLSRPALYASSIARIPLASPRCVLFISRFPALCDIDRALCYTVLFHPGHTVSRHPAVHRAVRVAIVYRASRCR